MNIDTLVEIFYTKQDETENLINEVLALFLETEKPLARILVEEKGMSLSWDGIPDIPIYEIPWSDVKTVEGGADIQGPQRQQLMQFLDDIAGDDLKDKVDGIAKFYDADVSQLIAATEGKSPKEKITYALGYLTFFKTLTKIIAHFNASSAGFSFEAFLGVLLGGAQIATGEGTIADLTAKVGGNEVPISLKLYTEGQLKVGGSFTDLVNDLRKYEQMQYVAVTKTLNDEKTAGTLDFYRFDFTLDNIAEILAHGGLENPSLIRLPAGFVADPGAFQDIEIPDPPTAAELLEIYEARVKELGSQFPQDVLDAALDAIGLPEDTRYLTGQKKIFGRSKLGKISSSMNPSTKSNRWFAQQIGLISDEEAADIDPSAWRSQAKWAKAEKAQWLAKYGPQVEMALKIYYEVVQEAYNDVVDEMNRNLNARAALRQQAGGAYLNARDSRDAYNDPKMTPALKKKALLLSAGYTWTEQFELTQPRILRIKDLAAPYPAFPPGQEEVKLGSIEVGQEQVVALMKTVSEVIDTSVFAIFEDLKELTTNIQAYFGNGLQDDAQAAKAIEASNSIGSRTKELSDTEK